MDLSTAQAHLDAWLAADLAVASGRTVQIADRTVSKEDAVTIRGQIEYWQRVVNNLNAAASGAQLGVKVAYWP